MKLNSLNKNFALASVSLLALSTLAGFSGLATVNAKTTNVADQVSNGEVAIYAQSAAGNQNPTQNNGLVDSDGNPVNDSGIANNQTGGQAGNTGSTKNDGSQQTTLEGSTPSTMANVTFSATLLLIFYLHLYLLIEYDPLSLLMVFDITFLQL